MASNGPYLFVKHSEHWNVDRCTRWMGRRDFDLDWCYPVNGDVFPDPSRYAGIIVFGGANSANDCAEHDWVKQELSFVERCLKHDVPFFGICLGAQMLARVLGATVRPHEKECKEIGFYDVLPTEEGRDFLQAPLKFMQWHSEGFDLPAGSRRIATGHDFPNQGFALSDTTLGVQFHPEVNPDVLAIWHERNKKRKPGQLSDEDRRRMMRDAYAHDAAITAWLDGFLTQWTSIAASKSVS